MLIRSERPGSSPDRQGAGRLRLDQGRCQQAVIQGCCQQAVIEVLHLAQELVKLPSHLPCIHCLKSYRRRDREGREPVLWLGWTSMEGVSRAAYNDRTKRQRTQSEHRLGHLDDIRNLCVTPRLGDLHLVSSNPRRRETLASFAGNEFTVGSMLAAIDSCRL